jgi:hypothetical protein
VNRQAEEAVAHGAADDERPTAPLAHGASDAQDVRR